jgi:hypothetical protein
MIIDESRPAIVQRCPPDGSLFECSSKDSASGSQGLFVGCCPISHTSMMSMSGYTSRPMRHVMRFRSPLDNQPNPIASQRSKTVVVANYRVAENGSNRHRQIPNAATRDPVNFWYY